MLRFASVLLAAVVCVCVVFASSFIAALDNGAFLIPPKGLSTWCTGPKYQAGECGRDVCTDSEIRRMVFALKSSGLFDLGYNGLMIDDCWCHRTRLANGTITWDPTRFPFGMPALVDFVHSQDITIGLYLSAGNTTCSSGGRDGPVVGSEGHYAQDIATLQSWNVDGVKLDWCGDVKKLPLDGIEVGFKAYANFSNDLMNSANPGMWFQGVAAVLFMWGDTPTYVNDWRMAMDHHDSARNMFEDIIFPMTGLEPQGRPGGWADLDVLMTGGQGCNQGGVNSSHCPGMTDTEYITEFTIWSMIQSPLFVATDISDITPIMKKILFNKLILNMHSDIRTAPGKYVGGDHKNCPFLGRDLCSYWVRQLADGSVYLVLLNANLGNPQKIEFNFGENTKHLPAGWGANTTVSVVDVWANSSSNQVRATGKWTAVVASHGVSAVILTPLA